MRHDSAHDPLLASALREISPAPTGATDIAVLRRRIGRRAAPELTRRRWRSRRKRVLVPGALAASIALLLFGTYTPPDPILGRQAAASGAGGARQESVEQLLDADVSDRQFQALLFGAVEADDLLLIAAEERQQ